MYMLDVIKDEIDTPDNVMLLPSIPPLLSLNCLLSSTCSASTGCSL